MLQCIFTHHQVTPFYLDFISVFGSQLLQRDLRFSGFREQIILSPAHSGSPAIPSLGRSGRLYQLCYNLKMVAVIKPDGQNPMPSRWPIRQAAFHHQFDVETGRSLWICTKGRLDDLRDRTKQLTGRSGRPEDHDYTSVVSSFKATLPVHLMYCHWAVEGWRWYIRHLEELVERKVLLIPRLRSIVITIQFSELTEHKTSNIVDIPRHEANMLKGRYNSDDLRKVQAYEDDISEAIMVMRSNVSVMALLQSFYEKILRHRDWPDELKQNGQEAVLELSSQLDDIKHELNSSIERADLLIQFMAGRKNLVNRALPHAFTSTDHFPDPTRYSNPSNRNHGEYDSAVPERIFDGKNCLPRDILLSPCNFCFGELLF